MKRELRKFQSSSSKAKECDRVMIPKFAQPENYRTWKIRLRDAIIAASSKLDIASHWIEEVFKIDQTVEAPKGPGKL